MNAHSKTAGLAGRDGLGISKAVTAQKYHLIAKNSNDIAPFEHIGAPSRQVLVNCLAARLHINPALASVAFELAMLGRRAGQ